MRIMAKMKKATNHQLERLNDASGLEWIVNVYTSTPLTLPAHSLRFLRWQLFATGASPPISLAAPVNAPNVSLRTKVDDQSIAHGIAGDTFNAYALAV